MKTIKNIIMLSLIGILVPVNAYASLLTFTLNTEFSGGAIPSGFPTVSIQDFGTSTVQVTITSPLISGSTEFIDDVLLNYGGSNALSASYVSGAAANTVSFGSNAFKADGAGFFDVLFDYPPPPGSFAAKFTTGETSIYNLSISSGTLSVADFNFLSTASAKGSFLGAAHIQGIAADANGNTSGWVGGTCSNCPPPPPPDVVPEPAAVWMLGLGLLGLVGYKRRQVQHAA